MSEVKVTLCQRGFAVPYHFCFAVPYHFSISITGGFVFGHAETCFHVEYIPHVALKGLNVYIGICR